MTAIVLHWIERMAGQPHAQQVSTGHGGVCPMNALLLGMMSCMAVGSAQFVLIPDGPLSLQQQFFFGMIAGTVGTLVGCAVTDTPDMRSLSRRALLNLFLAGVCAPLTCSLIPMPTTVAVIAPVAGLLGLGGNVPYNDIWPYLAKALGRRAKKEIETFIGPDDSNG